MHLDPTTGKPSLVTPVRGRFKANTSKIKAVLTTHKTTQSLDIKGASVDPSKSPEPYVIPTIKKESKPEKLPIDPRSAQTPSPPAFEMGAAASSIQTDDKKQPSQPDSGYAGDMDERFNVSKYEILQTCHNDEDLDKQPLFWKVVLFFFPNYPLLDLNSDDPLKKEPDQTEEEYQEILELYNSVEDLDDPHFILLQLIANSNLHPKDITLRDLEELNIGTPEADIKEFSSRMWNFLLNKYPKAKLDIDISNGTFNPPSNENPQSIIDAYHFFFTFKPSVNEWLIYLHYKGLFSKENLIDYWNEKRMYTEKKPYNFLLPNEKQATTCLFLPSKDAHDFDSEEIEKLKSMGCSDEDIEKRFKDRNKPNLSLLNRASREAIATYTRTTVATKKLQVEEVLNLPEYKMIKVQNELDSIREQKTQLPTLNPQLNSLIEKEEKLQKTIDDLQQQAKQRTELLLTHYQHQQQQMLEDIQNLDQTNSNQQTLLTQSTKPRKSILKTTDPHPAKKDSKLRFAATRTEIIIPSHTQEDVTISDSKQSLSPSEISIYGIEKHRELLWLNYQSINQESIIEEAQEQLRDHRIKMNQNIENEDEYEDEDEDEDED